jgi:DNA-binding NarL/FixJ family response regulator
VITVLLAEDHAIVREGIRKVLECEPDMKVVGEIDDGLRVVDAASELSPNVVLLDLGLPGLHGLEVIRRMTRRPAANNVIVLSMHAHEDYVLGAFRNGAAGYVVKGANSRELVGAIRRVAGGGKYASPDVANHLVAAFLHGGENVSDLYETLTCREREVLQLIAEGHSNAGIAARLCISLRTVETHRSNVLRKLDLRTTTEIVRFALRRGILPPE